MGIPTAEFRFPLTTSWPKKRLNNHVSAHHVTQTTHKILKFISRSITMRDIIRVVCVCEPGQKDVRFYHINRSNQDKMKTTEKKTVQKKQVK